MKKRASIIKRLESLVEETEYYAEPGKKVYLISLLKDAISELENPSEG